jgi:hypothetical protein
LEKAMKAIVLKSAGLVSGLVCAATVTATSATAGPPSNGCPAGFTARTVDQWAALGYPHAPAILDDPSYGGNGDGIVCGLELGAGTANNHPSGLVLYEFMDNQLPA